MLALDLLLYVCQIYFVAVQLGKQCDSGGSYSTKHDAL